MFNGPSMRSFETAFDMQRRYIDFIMRSAFLPMQMMTRVGAFPTQSRALVRTVSDTPSDDQVIPVGEEYLHISKQVVPGETTRIIRSQVAAPVEQAVELITETIVVERRRPLGMTSSGDVLSEFVTEMTATSERPVVTKERRVIEEVSLRKERTVHVETIRDTVLRDRIDVHQPTRMPVVVPPQGNKHERQQQEARARSN